MDLETLTLPLAVSGAAFASGIGTAIAGVTALVGAMAVVTKATFKWADELDSIQDVIGGTNEEAAAFNFTLRKSGTDTETFNKSLVIMNKGLIKADGTLDTVGKAMETWGINVKDANGNLKPQSQLIDEVAKKYSSLGTQQEKINFLTEVFGRGGAEMIDFFDTLAADGGIDAVTQKVKDLGLAIDPQRYENFNRSLEELKLVGLGLAVTFTEKLMPVFEGLLNWVNTFRGLSASDALEKLGKDFSAWANSIDWEKVSADIIAGIDSVDWARVGASIHNGLSVSVNGIDWSGLFSSISSAFADFAVGLSGGSNWENVKATWSSNLEQLKTIVNTTLNDPKLFSDFQQNLALGAGWANAKVFWTTQLTQMKQILLVKLNEMKSNFTITLNNIKAAVSSAFSVIKSKISNAISGAVNAALDSLGGLGDKLSSLSGLISSVSSAASGAAGSKPTGGGRASGGYASGLTLVGENGAELVNLPSGAYVNNNVSSRAMMNQPVKAYIDYDELARTMGRVVGQQLQRA